MLVRIHELHIVVQFDIGRGHGTGLIYGKQQYLRVAGLVNLEFHLLEVKDDLRHVLYHAFDGSKFMLGSIHLEGRDSGTFQ